MNDKVKMLWEISKEQEEVFIASLPRTLEKDDTPLEELLRLIRRAEYRRGKDDGYAKAKADARKEIFDKLDIATETFSIVYIIDVMKELKQSLGEKT